jgi:hypothetical protein
MELKLFEELLQGFRPYYFLEFQVMYQFRIEQGLSKFSTSEINFLLSFNVDACPFGKFRMAVVLKSNMKGC